MTVEGLTTLNDLLVELNKDPAFRREYERQRPYYDFLRSISRRRKELGLTQKELAAKADTYQSNISRVESGECDIRLSTLIEIADALDTWVEIRLVPYLDEGVYRELLRSSAGSEPTQTYTVGPAVLQTVARG